MACKRSAVRSRLPPPRTIRGGEQSTLADGSRSPSSRGLGHHPFTVSTGVRIPLGTPINSSSYRYRLAEDNGASHNQPHYRRAWPAVCYFPRSFGGGCQVIVTVRR